MKALKKAKKSNTTSSWFIKADVTNMKEERSESVNLCNWMGDCDLCKSIYGKLQEAKREYDERVKWINGLGFKTRLN